MTLLLVDIRQEPRSSYSENAADMQRSLRPFASLCFHLLLMQLIQDQTGSLFSRTSSCNIAIMQRACVLAAALSQTSAVQLSSRDSAAEGVLRFASDRFLCRLIA